MFLVIYFKNGEMKSFEDVKLLESAVMKNGLPIVKEDHKLRFAFELGNRKRYAEFDKKVIAGYTWGEE